MNVLFPRRKALYPPNTLRSGAAYTLLRGVSMLGSLAINAFLVLLFIEMIARSDVVSSLEWIAWRPYHAFVSAALIFAVSAALLMCTGRMSAAIAIANFFFLLMAVIHHYLLEFKGTPFQFSDIVLAKEAVGIADRFLAGMQFSREIALGVIVLLILVPCLFIGLRLRLRGRQRLLASLVSLALCAGYTVFFLHVDVNRYIRLQPLKDYQDYGFMLGFAYTIPTPFSGNNDDLKKPENYSREQVEAILAPHAGSQQTPSQLPDVLFLMVESYFDMDELGKYAVNIDPIADFRHLQQAYWGGEYITRAYGGFTVFAEYEVLTGYRSSDTWGIPFINAKAMPLGMETIATVLKRHGYQTHVTHPNTREYYNRLRAYTAMGFDTIALAEDMEPAPDTSFSGYPSDAYFYDQIIKSYESRDKDKPWFCHAVTYQNHGPYSYALMDERIEVTGSAMTEKEAHVASNFAYSLKVGTDELLRLLEYFDNQERPVMVVVWGDHAPNLSFFGIEQPESPAALSEYYETPLLIWNNYGLEVTGLPENVAAYRLGAYVLRLLGIESDAYFNYLSSDSAENLYACMEGMVEKDGEAVMDEALYERAKQEMLVLHYDRLMGENYGGEVIR